MAKDDDEAEILVCDCQHTMTINGRELARHLGRDKALPVHTELCGAGLKTFENVVASGKSAVQVACTFQANLFSEVADSKGSETQLIFTNIRETAGWCEDKRQAAAKTAALLAAARHEPEPAGLINIESNGICLIYGPGQIALDAAGQLADHLSVSVLLTDTHDAITPPLIKQPIASGSIRAVKGSLGAFEIIVDGYAPLVPSSRASMEFVMPRDGASSKCDLILDLTGGPPLLSGHSHRDGYWHIDPADPVGLARALLRITDMVGEFEKPLYVKYNSAICAHARSGITGCTNCLDNCPAGAIQPAGDGVAIDPKICGGCGNCASVCPTGAVEYAFPNRNDLLKRAEILRDVYKNAGGTKPVLLLHDEELGTEVISALARYSHGLPANVIPLGLHAATRVGHVELSAMLAFGFEHVVVLTSPDRREELASLGQQADLMNAMLTALDLPGPRVHILAERDPDALEETLYGLEALAGVAAERFSATGLKRDIARVSLSKLHAASPAKPEVIALPAGAPYGRINIDNQRCTLCLACVSACPANALADSPERPEVAFTEAACVQCGICATTCPENVITLEPRYNFASSALAPEVLNAQQPFQCVRCGEPFGAKATVERVVEKLKGHSMFPDEKQLQLIQMCDNCRVITLAESENDPFKAGERPKVRTTEDYLSERDKAKKAGKTPDDFLT